MRCCFSPLREERVHCYQAPGSRVPRPHLQLATQHSQVTLNCNKPDLGSVTTKHPQTLCAFHSSLQHIQNHCHQAVYRNIPFPHQENSNLKYSSLRCLAHHTSVPSTQKAFLMYLLRTRVRTRKTQRQRGSCLNLCSELNLHPAAQTLQDLAN